MADERTGLDRRQELDIIRELATHASDIRHMKADLDQMVNAVKDMNATLISINATLSEAKGGWRMLLMFGGAGGIIGSLLTHIADWMPGK